MSTAALVVNTGARQTAAEFGNARRLLLERRHQRQVSEFAEHHMGYRHLPGSERDESVGLIDRHGGRVRIAVMIDLVRVVAVLGLVGREAVGHDGPAPFDA